MCLDRIMREDWPPFGYRFSLTYGCALKVRSFCSFCSSGGALGTCVVGR